VKGCSAAGGIAAAAFVLLSALSALSAGSALLGCGGGGGDARFPKRPEGCEVALYHDIPEIPTDNIGPVHAACSEDVTPDDCIRTLKDAVCKLGGDVVWGVGEPQRKNERVHYNGRAAHTKGPRAPKP
jgi:hypothetical protein